jgi:hypothetical protein
MQKLSRNDVKCEGISQSFDADRLRRFAFLRYSFLLPGGTMSDTQMHEAPKAHARIVFLGAVSPHWEVYGDYGDENLIEEFRARVLARLVLLPRDDPQFRRNMARIVRDAERELISIEWDMGDPDYEI